MFAPGKKFAISGNNLVAQNRQGVKQSPGSRTSKGPVETASMFDSSGSNMTNSVRMSASGPLAFNYYLTGLVPEHEDMLRRYYRDIYLYDNVCGSAVDMISAFPFSDWVLTGADRKQLDKYDESLFRLNLRSLLPEISAAYLVDGSFTGTLVFNHKDKVFTDILLHNPDECKVDPSPFYSHDPQITVINNEETRRFMSSNGKYAREIKAMFAEDFKRALMSTAYELNPVTTLYVPRRTLPSRPATSYLKRVLPMYLLEKQLYRGTLVEATKRQRSMFHVQVGDDNWEPTPEELEGMVAMFQQAEIDPLGAIIATRSGVTPQEIRQGGDFWKWTDTADVLVPYKLRALGISEAFLSADANFSNSETALSVFIENMDAYRAFLTYKVFTNRIFPIVSYANEFWKDGKRPDGAQTRLNMLYTINNQQGLVIPKVAWHKQLAAKSEENRMDTLSALSEKGIPIPLRMWASAAKVDIDTLVYELEEDKKTREVLKAYSKEYGMDSEGEGGAGGDDEGGEGGGSAAEEMASMRLPIELISKIRRRIPILARDYSRMGEVVGTTKTGKPRYIHNQKALNEQYNRWIAKAGTNLEDPHYREQLRRKVASKYGGQTPDLVGIGGFKK